jgi:hypothetical protein
LAYFHAGHFTQYYDDPQIAEISRNYFEKASQIGTNLQRPVISTALIELEGFTNPEAALRALERARNRTEYDFDKRPPRPSYISYLEACAHCLKATQGSEYSKSLQKAVARLQEAAQESSADWKELKDTFEYDRSKYFSVLTSDPGFSPEAERALQKLDSLIN